MRDGERSAAECSGATTPARWELHGLALDIDLSPAQVRAGVQWAPAG
jgi:hypothetical protein